MFIGRWIRWGGCGDWACSPWLIFGFGLVAADERDDKRIGYSSGKKLAGLGYNWQQSYADTNPLCRRFVESVKIESTPFDKAMANVLDPVGLGYRVEDGQVILYRR